MFVHLNVYYRLRKRAFGSPCWRPVHFVTKQVSRTKLHSHLLSSLNFNTELFVCAECIRSCVRVCFVRALNLIDDFMQCDKLSREKLSGARIERRDELRASLRVCDWRAARRAGMAAFFTAPDNASTLEVMFWMHAERRKNRIRYGWFFAVVYFGSGSWE